MPDLGKKITCPKCTKKFYDMGRAELVCPSCRQQVDLSAQSNGKNTAKLAPEIDPDLEEFDESDEFDEDDLSFSKLDDRTFIFEAKISLKDFFKAINLQEIEIFESIKGDSETLAGLLLEIAKKFPKKGQKIRFKNYAFIVEELDQMRIKQVKVEIPKK